MRSQTVIPILPLIFITSTLTVGCSTKRSPSKCENLFAMEKKCTGNFLMPQKPFLALCEGANKKRIAADFACLKETTCEAFLKCGEEHRHHMLSNQLDKAIEFMSTKGVFAQLNKKCTQYKGHLSPKAQMICQRSVDERYTTLHKELIAIRDKGSPHHAACEGLSSFVKKNLPGKMAETKALCLDANFARFAVKARQRMQVYEKKKRRRLPPHCRIKYLKQFEKLNTPYIKAGLKRLVQECYIEYGGAMLKRIAAAKLRGCSLGFYTAGLKRYKVQNKTITSLLEAAQKWCDK